MGRRRGRKKVGNKDRIEVAETPLGTFTLQGRFFTMAGPGETPERTAYIDKLLASKEGIETAQAERRARLIEALRSVGPLRLVSIGSLTYLRKDPNTYKEWEDDRPAAHLEYLALQALALQGEEESESVDAPDAFKSSLDALSIVREMFENAQMLLLIGSIETQREDPENPALDHVMRARLESLSVRHAAYDKHLKRIGIGCLAPFDNECFELLGFTVEQAIAVYQAIGLVLEERQSLLDVAAQDSYGVMENELKRARRGRSHSIEFPDFMLSGNYDAAKVHLRALSLAWTFVDVEDTTYLDADSLAARSDVPTDACLAILEAFAAEPADYIESRHAMPTGVHPLTVTPLLRASVNGQFVAPVPTLFLDALRPRMEDLLSRDQKVWQRYLKARGTYLEKETTRCLSESLSGSSRWMGVQWSSPDSNSDLDGLVAVDDVALRVQAKAGRISGSARRGAPERMQRNLRDNIEAAAQQHALLDLELKKYGATKLGFNAAQARALNAPLQLEVIACLDDVTVWATQAHTLRALGFFGEGRDIPWTLSLADLMVVTEMLSGPQLLQYILRRGRIESDGRIETHDELDWLGHYILEGLYFDEFFRSNEALTGFRLLSYTEQFDSWYAFEAGDRTVATRKPSQDIPIRLRQILEKLEREQPEHWTLYSISLLEGDGDGRAKFADIVSECDRLVEEKGWSNATIGYSSSFGITYWVNKSLHPRDAKTATRYYCREKLQQHEHEAWLALAVGSRPQFAVVIEEDEAGPGVVGLLRPRSYSATPSASSGTTI